MRHCWVRSFSRRINVSEFRKCLLSQILFWHDCLRCLFENMVCCNQRNYWVSTECRVWWPLTQEEQYCWLSVRIFLPWLLVSVAFRDSCAMCWSRYGALGVSVQNENAWVCPGAWCAGSCGSPALELRMEMWHLIWGIFCNAKNNLHYGF